VRRWDGSITGLGDYLVIHGFFLSVLLPFLLVEVLRREPQGGPTHLLQLLLTRWSRLPRLMHLYGVLAQERSPWYRMSVWGLIVALSLSVVLAVLGWDVLALSLPFIGMGVLLLIWRPHQSARRRLVLFALLLAWGLTLGVEIVVLKGDIGRMNTVFKFYLQVWVLWALSAATALAWILPRLRRRRGRWLWWRTGACLLLAACLVYTPLATRAKTNDRFDRSIGPTLDGMAYMRLATYQEGDSTLELEWDRQAIEWMLVNIQGSPVVLEANVLLYRWGSRVSIYTGLPTIVGWDWHQRQQRGHIAGEAVNRRVREVEEIYSTDDLDRAQDLLGRYRVRYVYVGELERAVYRPDGLTKFEQWSEDGFLRTVYRNPGVTVYEVVG
jgi:YYY domain-containing protein